MWVYPGSHAEENQRRRKRKPQRGWRLRSEVYNAATLRAGYQ